MLELFYFIPALCHVEIRGDSNNLKLDQFTIVTFLGVYCIEMTLRSYKILNFYIKKLEVSNKQLQIVE